MTQTEHHSVPTNAGKSHTHKLSNEQLDNLVSQLTLDDKIAMIHGAGLFRTEGVERLGIPAFVMSDGPMGVRREFDNAHWNAIWNTRDFVTYLPSGSAIASTWNPQRARDMGEVLGQETRGRGKDMILAPSVNIKRSPLCGRNFEYMSEDPLLTARQAVPFIEGIQESDVAACVKHFVANSQETDRLQVDESISERALREIYLPAFQASIQQAHSLGIMGAYNLVNGERCCESHTFLGKILRGEWGFEGIAVSDWGGVFRTKESAESSLDIEMSVTDNFDDYKFAQPLKQAVLAGDVDEKHLDAKCKHILHVMNELHMLGADRSHRQTGSYATAEHRAAALKTAEESIIVLKNDASVLPLQAQELHKVLVIGHNADFIHSSGGGSAEIKTLYEISPLLGLSSALGGNTQIDYLPGYETDKSENQNDNWQEESLKDGVRTHSSQDSEKNVALRCEAVEAAQSGHYDAVIYVGGLNHDFDVEGLDRTDMKLPYGQDQLISELLDVQPHAVIVLVGGSPVEMPWADKASTLVWNWYAGSESGTALAHVLLGSVNPSGHLPESFPVQLEDSPAHAVGTFGLKGHVRYDEDIFVGYRYFETHNIPVRFCFGYGLSYTTFAYKDFMVEREIQAGQQAIRVAFSIENTGDRAGYAVPQLYVGYENTGDERPVKELKAFDKVFIESGDSAHVEMSLPASDFVYWSDGWKQAGDIRLYIGESVRDINYRTFVSLDHE
ncbi:glycoside hydrolase family 3 C-terminal domain-containing protein [Alloscardovia criceti]|uniref:glycoside hydrolase family 3 C-terminal domain-containing protein n=1 Tax=Alloscardovia criceti TaxID=356828 RepID=UPI0003625CE6|nr:glycoside hydrolase family 3 C-terminal domain-containing protein [Alloscardovia criceti]